ESWIWQLPADAIVEIDEAVRLLESNACTIPNIQKADFPLPTLGPELERLAHEVEYGKGFQIIRGLPVERYSDDQLRKIFWGIGLYFGNLVGQTKDNQWVVDVRDEGRALGQNQRGYHSQDTLDFHTDGATIVALLCI